MAVPIIMVQGFVKPDGTLELDEKVALPTGRVQVTVVSMLELPKDDPFWQMLERIWADQRARGHQARSVPEVEGEREQLRQEWEQRMQRLEQIQAEAEAIRRTRGPGT